jgi:transcriptional regulator with GAF, ATPase, and Fis domain
MMDEHDDLTTSVLELASLVADHATLEATLSRILGFATQLIHAADGGVLTLLDGGPGVTVSTDALVAAAEQARLEAVEGPSVTVVAAQRVVVSGSLGTDRAWPKFGGRAARLGIHSALSVPLTLNETMLGVMTLYARARNAFGPGDAVVAQDYARPAAAVARNAHVLARSEVQINQLNEALRIRPVIDQAIGIIRLRTGKSAAEAFQRLCEISNAEHIKVSDVARDMVEEAVRSANARRRTS